MGWSLTRRTDFSTGWVPVPIPVGEGSLLDGTGNVQVRRRGGTIPADDLVDIRFTGVGVLPTATAGQYLTPPGFLPPGFRAWYSERAKHRIGNTAGGSIHEIAVIQGSRIRLEPTSAIPGTGTHALQGTITILADDARPSGGA